MSTLRIPTGALFSMSSQFWRKCTSVAVSTKPRALAIGFSAVFLVNPLFGSSGEFDLVGAEDAMTAFCSAAFFSSYSRFSKLVCCDCRWDLASSTVSVAKAVSTGLDAAVRLMFCSIVDLHQRSR